jgi:hypothetical protein
MRDLENAFKFTFKNFLIALPLLISMAIPSLIMNVGTMGFSFNFIQKYQQLMQDMMYNQNADYSMSFLNDFFADLISPKMIISIIVASLLSIIFAIIVYPATYGMINKKYETGEATLSDFIPCMSKYIGRYVQFALLSLAIGIGLSLVLLILGGIAGVIMATVNVAVGILLLVLFILAYIVGAIALGVYMYLWFPAVCVENTGIIEGLKNSFRKVKGSFWSLFGITILITLGGSIAGGILGWVPLIGSVVQSVISSLVTFVNIVFYFEVYRNKTGRYTIPEGFKPITDQMQ